MRTLCLLMAMALMISCKEEKQLELETHTMDSLEMPHDSIPPEAADDVQPLRKFSNERFKEVTVRFKSGNTYEITGKAQVFEANFGWVVEDGHDELDSGFVTADAGAPAWGAFKFEVDVKKVRDNSSLHLILFESSAKDGSRQYELPVLLY